ncbi:MAG: Sjogren's syndrome/scleroderma autoantigen 1 family protein [Nitrosopumilus sp.]
MSKDLQKRAAEMLLNGATLLSEPCPYCKGVRVMKGGQALCIKCGKEPEKREIPKENKQEKKKNPLKNTLEKKLEEKENEILMIKQKGKND